MGSWVVDAERKPGIVWVEVVGSLSPEETQSFVDANIAAVDGLAGKAYAVFCDARAMKALTPEAAILFEKAKAYSSAQPNFIGSAILVASTVVGMQHRRTSTSGGVMSTEMISGDESSLWEHLAVLAAAN
jgi:hypothetical protein